jgi:O-acetyl-ADP-ribose deacetylase (regulator of RNase III)
LQHLYGCVDGQEQRAAGGFRSVKADQTVVSEQQQGTRAGVWVIAETTDLPTRYIKEVVTDDSGRYLILALPKANYTVHGAAMAWDRQRCRPLWASRSTADHRAGCEDCAVLYPGNYWYC